VKSRADKECVFNNLGHVIDLELLRECHRSLDGSKAVGIDGVSKEAYGKNIEENLTDLLSRIRRGTYVPRPSRVVEIPKVDGTTRPLAIACVEDKIVQEACKRILERIYEPVFLPESFGFRPGSSPHKALVALNGHLKSGNNGAVVDVDLRRAFDTIPHEHLEAMLRRKISDARFLHLLLKLIRAETVGADGVSRKSPCGVPQGSILSPLLCNVFLHHVIDEWFREYNGRFLGGRGSLVRYADDLVMTALNVAQAQRLHDALSERVRSFGMSLHGGKTRVIPNGPLTAKLAAIRGERVPGFTFLGFLHVWGKSRNRKTGKEFWRVKLRTCPKRFRAKLASVTEYIRKNRHSKTLLVRMKAVVQGYLNYFAINDNLSRVGSFVYWVRRILFKWLCRRSQRCTLTWNEFRSILDRVSFPVPKVQHNLFFSTSAFNTQC
jgi:group II intron reverse transcriptase/maturase